MCKTPPERAGASDVLPPSLAHSPDPSERPSLPMSGTVMAAVATLSVGMVV